MRQEERPAARGAERPHAAQDRLAAGLAHEDAKSTSGAPQVVTTPIFADMRHSETMRPPSGGSLKATSVAQTRSSQPFSMAGRPYHQVG